MDFVRELQDLSYLDWTDTKMLGDLDGVLQTEHLDKIWEMIWRRWERYVQICN